MNKKPKFSVITICLNVENTIQQCVESCLNQEFIDYEYIVIDGGSTDQTISILNEFKDSIDILISEKDKGISDAFNKGIEKASGEYICFVNADDWLEPNALVDISNLAKDPIIYTAGVKIWSRHEIIARSLSHPEKLKTESLVHHAATFIHASIFHKLGGFKAEFNYAMDYDFFLRCHMNSIRFNNLAIIVSNRRLGGVSNTNNWKALKETREIRSQYFSGFQLHIPFYYSVIKNYIGILLKKVGLTSVYKKYWDLKNKMLFIK